MREKDYEDALAEMMAFVDSVPAPDSGQDDKARPQEPGPWGQAQEGGGDQDPGEVEEAPELFYGSVDDFVREMLVHLYRRKVGPRGSRRWSAQWWRNAEAIARLEALWRAWENLRQDGATGMSTWWRDHADYHMQQLFDPDGPFAASEDENKAGAPLPYDPPPAGLFPDVRTM